MTAWDPAERDRVAALCEEHAIHTVECVFVDTWGMPRGKRLPVRQFLRGSGFAIANVVYTWDPTCFIFATPWVDETDGFPDMHVVPDHLQRMKGEHQLVVFDEVTGENQDFFLRHVS